MTKGNYECARKTMWVSINAVCQWIVVMLRIKFYIAILFLRGRNHNDFKLHFFLF
jgi:hypothetical protein